MNDICAAVIREWYDRVQPERVADLGSLNLNGAVRDIIPVACGFDICSGPGVDVVLEAGAVLPEHEAAYDGLVAASAYQFAPEPEQFLNEAWRLLRPGGSLLLTMCPLYCTAEHSTSPELTGTRETRHSLFVLACVCASRFELVNATTHRHMYVYEGVRR